jgi:hypothetical protein
LIQVCLGSSKCLFDSDFQEVVSLAKRVHLKQLDALALDRR